MLTRFLSDVVTAASIKVTKPDGTSENIATGTTSGLVQYDNAATTNTFAAIEVSGNVATQAAIGTYKFEVVPAGDPANTVLTRSITVTNSSTDKLTAEVVKTTVNRTEDGISTIDDLLTKDVIYSYAGKSYGTGKDYSVTVTGYKAILSDGTTKELKVDGTGDTTTTSLNAVSSVSIQNVTIQVTLTNKAGTSTVRFNQPVNIGKTITLQ